MGHRPQQKWIDDFPNRLKLLREQEKMILESAVRRRPEDAYVQRIMEVFNEQEKCEHDWNIEQRFFDPDDYIYAECKKCKAHVDYIIDTWENPDQVPLMRLTGITIIY